VRDPDSGWHALPTAPTYLSSSSPIWTGHELVTETSDGRIATFGSLAPPTLPGCPARWEPDGGKYDASARIDVSDVIDASVCSYDLADTTGHYDHPVAHELTATQRAALIQALSGARPFNPALADCSGTPSSHAYTIYLLTPDSVRVATRGGAGCSLLVADGHYFGGDPAVHDVLREIIG
jgi:hypothetical protein